MVYQQISCKKCLYACFDNTLKKKPFWLQCIMSKNGATPKKVAMCQNAQQRHSTNSSFKEIHIAEEVKIAVSLALERFHYSEQKGMSCFWSI